MRVSANLSRSIVYLKQPVMTSAFRVSVVRRGENQGEIEGAEADLFAKFLGTSHGVPRFDLEFESNQYCRCVLGGELSSRPIPFAFDSLVEIEEPKSGGEH